jgi:DnaK suppressor protein
MPGKNAKKPAAKSASKKPVVKAVAKAVKKPAAKAPSKPKGKPAAKPVAKKAAPVAVSKVASKKPVPSKAVAKVVPKAVAKPPVVGAKKSTMSSDALQFKGYTPYVERKGEKYMSPGQVKHFVKILEAWKHELMEKVDETVHHMQDEAANYPDPNDRASQESDFTMELRTRDRERKLIKKIEEAMQALDDGEYGYCESCGIEIGIRRLEARPTATLCIDCKELDEIREKQTKG